jgi:alcohol dehydrogenase, propanol-preferring
MRALRLMEWKSDPVLVEVADPLPGPGQVVIRVGGADACHSDLHMMHEFEAGQLGWGRHSRWVMRMLAGFILWGRA